MVQKNKVKKFVIAVLWIVVNVLCILGLAVSIYCYNTDKKILQKDNGYVYFALQHESSPLSADMQQLVNFKSELKNTNFFQYYEIYAQPLYSSDIFLAGGNTQKTGDGMYALQALQTGSCVLDDFGVTLQDGRDFDGTDYMLESDHRIPVIIGADWSDVFRTGDCFQAEYLYDTYQFYVIGILQPQSMIYMTNRIYPLDTYIIMPSFEMADDVAASDGLRIHYANKVSGIARAKKEDQKRARQYLVSCIENTSSGAYSWYATVYDCNLQRIIHLGTREIFILCSCIIVIGNCFIFVRKRSRQDSQH